jgi:hypothetical protein
VSPDEGSAVNTNIIQTSSVNKWLAATLAVEDATETPLMDPRLDGNFVVYQTERVAGGVTVQEGGIKYESGGSAVEGNVGEFSGTEGEGMFLATFREGFSGLQAQPGGDQTYTGNTVVFAGEDSYTATGTTVTLNFDTNTGNFNASAFTPDDGVATPRTITITGALEIDPSTGSLNSSSEGSINVNGDTSAVYIDGLLTGDGTGAAGTIVTYDDEAVDGVIGGIYAVSK